MVKEHFKAWIICIIKSKTSIIFINCSDFKNINEKIIINIKTIFLKGRYVYF